MRTLSCKVQQRSSVQATIIMICSVVAAYILQSAKAAIHASDTLKATTPRHARRQWPRSRQVTFRRPLYGYHKKSFSRSQAFVAGWWTVGSR